MTTALKTVSAEITINASKQTVWSIWSKFVNVSDYIAGVPESYGIGNIKSGLGACRRCDISEKMQVEERITDWQEHQGYSMEVYRATGVPMDTMKVDFELTELAGKTKATVTMHYKMKGLLRFLPLKGLLNQQAKDHLMGLKHHVETGDKVVEQSLKTIRKQYSTVCVAL